MAKPSFGWAGKLLWVDLSSRKITKVPTSDFEPETYIGGQGLNCKIFLELGCPKVSAFHPDNPLLLAIGPLTGSGGPFGRGTICSIGPQCYPDELFTYSGFGGKFPSELKYAGYDGIIILGKADVPVYLSVCDGDVAIRDAKDLWGLDTLETQSALSRRHPRASVLAIGPAGENLSRMAIIINETTGAAGQGGFGAVMGSKHLKAIVVRGTGSIRMAHPDTFLELISQRKAAGEWVAGPYQVWGRRMHSSEIIEEEMRDKYLKKFSGCYACPYQCQSFYDMPGIGQGSQNCNDSWYGWFNRFSAKGAWEGNVLSQKLGINNFELTGLLMFLKEAIATGVLEMEDAGLPFIPIDNDSCSILVPPTTGTVPLYDKSKVERGLEPAYGGDGAHHRFLETLLGGIARGSSPFSQGTARAAKQFGSRAVAVYDALFPAHGHLTHILGSPAMALHWATDTRDPFDSCHDYQVFDNSQVTDRFNLPAYNRENMYDGAEDQAVWVQHHQSLKNSLTICEFASYPNQFLHPPEMDIRVFESQCLSAATGLDMDADSLWKSGEAIYNLRRAIAVLREGRHRTGDTISPVWFDRTVGALGVALPEPLDKIQWEELKDRYYALRGWDIGTGVPQRAKLVDLGMRGIADKLGRDGNAE